MTEYNTRNVPESENKGFCHLAASWWLTNHHSQHLLVVIEF